MAQQGAIKDKHGDWETRCETPPGAAYEQCAIVLSVVDQERPNLTLVVIVLNTADRKARLMRVIAPLGVLLPPGVGLADRRRRISAGSVSCSASPTAASPSSPSTTSCSTS